MPTLSWNEIRDRALKFSKEWQGESRERAEKDSFYNDFFHVFGISRRRVATFEEPVKKINDRYGFIDLFWKGKLLIEHKSKGQDLNRAYDQALDYFHGLKEHELPKYVLVSDFAQFRLYNLDTSTEHRFTIAEFVDNIQLFGFIAGWEQRTIREEDPVNIEAAELMGQLHDRLDQAGYTGHDLEVYLVRLLFCLFADDTGIFERGIFEDYIRDCTREDGSDLSYHIAQIFQTFDTPTESRLKTMDDSINAFPYVNGELFSESVRIASFDSEMREMLLQACMLDWGEISPAIFGSMFQAAMNPQERRNLGAHYTSEKNILKVIKPLFLDELHARFDKAKRSPKKLRELHSYIASLTFLDPACGSGNFLIITYRELRRLELEILRALRKDGQMILDVRELLQVSINQYYGIEYEEFAAKVAEVGMWLVEHQMNEAVSLEFGQNVINLPLQDSANIQHGNALRIDWEDVVPKDQLNYIIGNPPFSGHHYQDIEQKKDVELVFEGRKGIKVLDYVACWFQRCAEFMSANRSTISALVCTNSIVQGEQVGLLWNNLINNFDIKIHFAHQTFRWSNEAKGKAAVHCVIIGFGTIENDLKLIYEYPDVKGEALSKSASNINPYLVEGPNVIMTNRSQPICDAPRMIWGNKPTDGGNFLFKDAQERDEFLASEPNAQKWVRPYVSGRDFLHNHYRYCLWLRDISPSELRKLPEVLKRVQGVKEMRLSSKSKITQAKASSPTIFAQIAQPEKNYLAIPEVSSERRDYIPIGFIDSKVIASNTIQLIPNATPYIFGVITSSMHMVWMALVCGRLESRYRYSNTIVYNNFPWPKDPTDKQKEKVETCAQTVLDARERYPDSSLADLYDPLTMPPDLVKAHQQLDRAVDRCYRPQPFTSERNRIEYLFELYEQYTAPLLAAEQSKGKKSRKKKG